LEGSPEEMKAAGITRATLQIRYMKLGKEMETNIPYSVAKGEASTAGTIYMDRDSRGYACRLVFDHKEKGKMALEWKPETSDYVYASIPEGFRDPTSTAVAKALEIGKTLVRPAADGTVSKTEQVLDKFKDILGVAR
jgi:hypothetical protein